MEITDIRPTAHGNIAVSADGEFLLAASPDAWVRCALSVGDEISASQIDFLRRETAYDAAKKKALAMLSARAYTRRQLVERLARTHGEDAAELAVSRMQELGLIDDADYALRFARELSETRSYAPRRIRYEMQKRGIPREDIDAALVEFKDFDELGAAVALLEKKYNILTTDAEIRRAAALLERCGYSGETIRTAIHAVRRFKSED